MEHELTVDSELKSRLIHYLDTVERIVSDTAAFTAEQAPQVAHEIVAWHFYSHMFGAVVLAALSIIVAAIATITYRNAEKIDPVATEVVQLFSYVIGAILTAALLGFSISNTSEAIKAQVAPRLVVLERIADIAK